LTPNDRKFALFDIFDTITPDPANGVHVDYWYGPDYTYNCKACTMNTKLWSTNRTSGCNTRTPFCDQENENSLELFNGFCNTNGGSQSISAGGTLGGTAGSVNLGYSYTVPTFDGCLEIPGADSYSRYYSYTLQDVGQIDGVRTLDFPFAQSAPYGYNSRTLGIGLFAQGLFWITHSGCYCDFSVDTGNWWDNYVYTS
jgi:hypothetical protein